MIALVHTAAWAQPAPQSLPGMRADEFQRQQERERALREQQETTPDVRLQRPTVAEPQLPKGETPCFVVHKLQLQGEEAQRFQWALQAADVPHDPVTGACTGAGGVGVVLTRVQNALIARGYITTRVVAAPQDLSGGVLTLTMIPGRIRHIRFQDGTTERATQWNAFPARAGDILNLRDIEQALENFKRVPTAEADIRIAPAEAAGPRSGQSDVVISWKQGLPFRLALSADDSGSKHTGKYQGSATFSYDHWWTLNDIFYASVSNDLGTEEAGKGTRGYTVHYDVPYGYWLLGATASSYYYRQSVAGASQTYLYSGSSRNQEVRVARILHRDAAGKTGAYVRGWSRASSNFIDDTEIEVQRRRVSGWELGLTHRRFLRAATVDSSVAYRRGTGARNAMAAPEEPFGEGTSRLRLVTADAQLAAPFELAGQRVRYTAAWRAQWARTPLVPQDRFSIGGRYTVRGFDGELSLSAQRGWLVRNELAWAMGAYGAELYAGIDYGHVGGESSRLLVGTDLAGTVLGVRASHKGWALDLFAGTPLHKPEGFRTARVTSGFSLGYAF